MLTQEQIIKMMSEFGTEKKWATKSKFYGSIMADGNIFNPYIHRRFLPAHYMKLRKDIKISGVDVFCYWYSLKYSMNYLQKETELLAYLQKVDIIAYEERKMIFTIERCKAILCEFLFRVKEILKTHNGNPHFCLIYVSRKNTNETEIIINNLSDEVQKCCDYKQCSELIKEISIAFRSYYEYFSRNIPRTFIDTFLLAGAYFTVKNILMFKKEIDNRIIECDKIFAALKDGKDAMFFDNMIDKFNSKENLK